MERSLPRFSISVITLWQQLPVRAPSTGFSDWLIISEFKLLTTPACRVPAFCPAVTFAAAKLPLPIQFTALVPIAKRTAPLLITFRLTFLQTQPVAVPDNRLALDVTFHEGHGVPFRPAAGIASPTPVLAVVQVRAGVLNASVGMPGCILSLPSAIA